MKGLILLTLVAAAAIHLGGRNAQAHEVKEPPRYTLSVSVDTNTGRLDGVARIAFPLGGEAKVRMGRLTPVSVSIDGKPVAVPSDGAFVGHGTVDIVYWGDFARSAVGENPANSGVVPSVIAPEGVSLTEGWYPYVEGLVRYQASALLPEGLTAISEAEDVIVTRAGDQTEHVFIFPYPTQGISLVAGRFEVLEERAGDVDVYAYFFAEDVDLAPEYLASARRYLELYAKMLGPYPYRRFSVVENFLESGYSMPTFTLLGRRVVRLPFIPKTSLGHEVLHQWFGNSVYADYVQGNWVEGLTTYMADHYAAREEGEGRAYRKKVLLDFQGQVPASKDFPLVAFMSREDFASRAVGYGKAMMVFHMLRMELGEEGFIRALRAFVRDNKFGAASWQDIEESFSHTSGVDLAWFFDQWLKRTGVIGFNMNSTTVRYLDGRARVEFELVQRGMPSRYLLPVIVVTDRGEVKRTVRVDQASGRFAIEVEGEPRELVLDPEYDLMRGLSEAEYPPAIARLVGGEKRIVAVPGARPPASASDGANPPAAPASVSASAAAGIYGPLVEAFAELGFEVKWEGELTDADIRGAELLVMGRGGPVIERLFGRGTVQGIPPEGDASAGFYLSVVENPVNPFHVLGVAYATSAEEVSAAAVRAPRYGRYARLGFERGKNTLKAEAESMTGVRIPLQTPVYAVRPAQALSLGAVLADVMDRDVIYVGEAHKDFEDHRVQLRIVMAMAASGRPFSIGMEMFESSAQGALDDYVAGRIEEPEFLKRSAYFKTWGFDFGYYREILSYARFRGIPVVALNVRRDIITKVAHGGLDELTPEERAAIPADMDMSDSGYRARLRDILGQHNRGNQARFEHFYQSQIIWDEYMARSVARYMEANPSRAMVVIAGQGHVAYRSGIPLRVHRRNGRPYAVLINSSGEGGMDPEIADYVIYSGPVPFVEAPMLGVQLAERDGAVVVEGFGDESAAQRAGVKKGDAVLALDGMAVGEIGDVRIALYEKKPGDSLRMRVKRKRLFMGEAELEIEVRF